MNNEGANSTALTSARIKINRIKDSYIYRLVSKVLSVIGTLVLICLIVIGSLMFYFNSKAKAAEKRGASYVPPFGLYTIISGSMEPNIHVYDVVVSVNEKDLSKIKVGDIITFISTWDVNYGLTVTHRVVGVSKNSYGEYQFTTKGDNNKDPDGAVVTQQNFVGKVVARLPYLGKLQFFLATKMGWFMVVFIPALGVIIYDLFKIFKLVVLKKQIDNVENYDELNSLPQMDASYEKTMNDGVKELDQTQDADIVLNQIEETDNQILNDQVNNEINEIHTAIKPRDKKDNEEKEDLNININRTSDISDINAIGIENNKDIENDETIELPQMVNINITAPNGRKPLERRKKQ